MPSRMGSTWPATTTTGRMAWSSPRRTPSYAPTTTGTTRSSRRAGAAGTLPETAPSAVQPALPCSCTWVSGRDPAVRPEPTTSSVPVDGWRRGSVTRTATASSAAAAAAAQRTRGLGSFLGLVQGPPPVSGGDMIDVTGAQICDLCALEENHVLGVLLTAVREVEASRVDVIVCDEDFGVHEVVHRALGVRRRALGAEPHRLGDALKSGDLPGCCRLRGPLDLHLVHLRRIVHT